MDKLLLASEPALRPKRVKPALSSLLVFSGIVLLFWGVYFRIGAALDAHDMLHNNFFFHSDTRRVIWDMCRFGSNHFRTSVHPLFVLMTNPVGLLLTKLTGAENTVAIALNSLTGALCVGAAGVFFRCAGLTLLRSALLALILGVSTSHLFFGSEPETYAFSALGIIALYLVLLKRPNRLWYAVIAALVSFGALITNFAIVGITFACGQLPVRKWSRAFQSVAFSLALVWALGMGLAVGQKLIWPSSAVFFVPSNVTGESRFISPKTSEPGYLAGRVKNVARYMFAFNWISPAVRAEADPKRGIEVGFSRDRFQSVGRAGIAGLILWGAMLLGGLWGFIKNRQFANPVSLALAAGVLFNFALHTVYGDDLFLYGCNSCFLILAWMALGLQSISASGIRRRLVDLALVALLCLIVANNLGFVRGITSAQLKGAPPAAQGTFEE